MPIPPPNSRQMLWCRPRCRNEPIVINCLRQCEQRAGRRYHVTNAMAASGPSMSHALRYALAMGLVYGAVSLSGCGDAEPAPRRTTLTFATGRRGFSADQFARAIIDIYSAKFPDLAFVFHPDRGGSFANVQNLRLGTADIGFAQADTAYLAYKRSSKDFRAQLRGMAVLNLTTLQLLVRKDSEIRSVSQFRGRRLSIGIPGGPSEVAARVILEAYGLTPNEVHFRSHDDLTMSEIAKRIRDKTTDVGIVATSFPISTISESPNEVGIELVSLEPDKIARIRSQYPFYEPIVISANTYTGQRSEITTIGTHGLLVCRDTLPEELVYRLTKAFFEALPGLRESYPAARFIDAEQGPGTPIPLHAGAARFYRERELTQ